VAHRDAAAAAPARSVPYSGMLAAGREIRRRWRTPVASSRANPRRVAAIRDNSRGSREGFSIAVGQTREVLAPIAFRHRRQRHRHVGMAHFGVPMVIIYRVPWLIRTVRRFMGRWAVPTRHFSLVNILAGGALCPN